MGCCWSSKCWTWIRRGLLNILQLLFDSRRSVVQQIRLDEVQIPPRITSGPRIPDQGGMRNVVDIVLGHTVFRWVASLYTFFHGHHREMRQNRLR